MYLKGWKLSGVGEIICEHDGILRVLEQGPGRGRWGDGNRGNRRNDYHHHYEDKEECAISKFEYLKSLVTGMMVFWRMLMVKYLY